MGSSKASGRLRSGSNRLYYAASDALRSLHEKGGTVKATILRSKYPNKKIVSALVYGVLNYYDMLKTLFERRSQEFESFNLEMFLVLAYEVVCGSGLKCGGSLVRPFKIKAEDLKKQAAALTADDETVKKGRIYPKFVRINTLKTSSKEVIDTLVSEGWEQAEERSWKNLTLKQFYVDDLVPDLLVLPGTTDIHQHSLIMSGKVMIQNKASCFPALALAPPAKSVVIDACSAPGNKTLHLSALMKNRGKIIACDITPHRVELLRSRVHAHGAKNIEVLHQDFLQTNTKADPFNLTEYILLDPSCSGSGVHDRFDNILQRKASKDSQDERLAKLSEFQLSCLNHAATFPKVKRIAYSTCSIHAVENERVVKKFLESHKDFVLTKCLPTFSGRGWDRECPDGSKCVRAEPDEHGTIGFFLALFEKVAQTNKQEARQEPEKPENHLANVNMRLKGNETKQMVRKLVSQTKNKKRRKSALRTAITK
eukprot:Clim_evm93s88 gene=Clim_evmTU93s88